MLNPERQEHIINLQSTLTTIGKAREDISLKLEELLDKQTFNKIIPEITGTFFFIQSSLAQQIQRLKSRRD